MALDVWFRSDVANGLLGPAQAMFPHLTEAERRVLVELVSAQLRVFGVACQLIEWDDTLRIASAGVLCYAERGDTQEGGTP